VALNPNFYTPTSILASCLRQLQDAAGAGSSFKKASSSVQTNRKSASNWPRFCARWEKQKRRRNKLKLYQQRLKEESDKSLAILKSTQVQRLTGHGDCASQSSVLRRQRDIRWAPGAESAACNRLAVVLGELGDTGGRGTALQQAIEADPEFAPAQYQLGYLETREGDMPRLNSNSGWR